MGDNRSKKEILTEIKKIIHDINNQLTVMKGKCEKLMDDETFASNLDVIKLNDKTDRVSNLIRSLRERVIELDVQV